ncbi:MAG: hypothetical protein HXY23_14240 [Parvularculaceae bacterium]|nr:hypothetical protein [Parvularculaceae bacterium]
MRHPKKRKPIKAIAKEGVGYVKMVMGYNRDDNNGPKLDFSFRPFLVGNEYEVRRGNRRENAQ